MTENRQLQSGYLGLLSVYCYYRQNFYIIKYLFPVQQGENLAKSCTWWVWFLHLHTFYSVWSWVREDINQDLSYLGFNLMAWLLINPQWRTEHWVGLSYKPILRAPFWSRLRINYKRQLPDQLFFLNQRNHVHLERPLPSTFIFKCPCLKSSSRGE